MAHCSRAFSITLISNSHKRIWQKAISSSETVKFKESDKESSAQEKDIQDLLVSRKKALNQKIGNLLAT